MIRLFTTRAFLSLAACAAAFSYANADTPAVAVDFSNNTMGERTSDSIYLNFVGGGAADINGSTGKVTYNNAASIGYYYDSSGAKNELYSNSSLKMTDLYDSSGAADSKVYINSWGSGRMYISYDKGFTGMSDTYTPTPGPYPGWQPQPTSDGVDPNFETRHQFWELTVQPNITKTTSGGSTAYAFGDANQMWADLTYIDYTAISLGMEVKNASGNTSVKNPTQWSANTQTMLDTVGHTKPPAPAPEYEPNSNYVTKTKKNGGTEQLYQIPGKANDSQPKPTYTNTQQFDPPTSNLSNFLRVAGPGAMPSKGGPGGEAAFYQSWKPYLHYMDGTAEKSYSGTTTIKGLYSVNGEQLAYNFTATFSSESTTIDGQTYTGYVTLTGTYNGETHTIVIPYTELLKNTGLYGANTGYSVDGAAIGAPGNNQWTWIVGDLLAGMNYGFVGSEVDNPLEGVSGTMIGEIDSSSWWGLGDVDGESYLFSVVQPDGTFYNVYAADVNEVTSGYGFAYGDRLGDNTTYFMIGDNGEVVMPDGTYLQLKIQPDQANVPEPQTVALVALGGLLMIVSFVRRRRQG